MSLPGGTVRAWWIGVGLVVVGVLAGAAWSVREVEPPPFERFVEQSIGDLDPRSPWVRVQGTAHYEAQLTQHEPATLLREERTQYVFAFFSVHDTDNREIPLLVRTTRPAERLVAYETMTVEGHLHPITKRDLPPETEVLLSKRSGYFFADTVLLLDAARILSEDGEWLEP